MSESKGKVSSKRSLRTKYKALDNKFKVLVVFGILFCAFGVGMGIWGSVWAYTEFVIGDDVTPEETPTTKATSTFTLLAYITDEDVSNFVKMDIWGPKDSADFSLGMEDITDLTTNFERIKTSANADDISIDMRVEPYYWAEITGNTVFNNTFHLIWGGVNRDYTYYVHQCSSDVNFNILNETMSPLAYGESWSADAALKGVDGNYTAILKSPHLTKTGNHYGDIGWEMTATEFAALTQRQKEIVWNEANYRDQFPTYDPTLDTDNKYYREWEVTTNTFALKWTLNVTIDASDVGVTDINCTIARGYPVEVWTTGVYLYMVWYEGIDFTPNPYTLEFEMFFGTHINVTTVISGRANVFGGSLSTLTWDETYSTIGL